MLKLLNVYFNMAMLTNSDAIFSVASYMTFKYIINAKNTESGVYENSLNQKMKAICTSYLYIKASLKLFN